MFASGATLAEKLLQNTDLNESQEQPNGVDLTVESVETQDEQGFIGKDGKTVGDRTEVPTIGQTDRYSLNPGAYIVTYGETITIPEDGIGFVLPRSSLLRNSAELHTAVWDAGYEGRGEGLLKVNHPIAIEHGARIGQLVVADADTETTYDGTYQHENLED